MIITKLSNFVVIGLGVVIAGVLCLLAGFDIGPLVPPPAQIDLMSPQYDPAQLSPAVIEKHDGMGKISWGIAGIYLFITGVWMTRTELKISSSHAIASPKK